MPSSQTVRSLLRDRLAPVCVAVAATDPVALFLSAENALAESRFLELRLDALATDALATDALTTPEAAVPRLEQFCRDHPQATILATCRRIAGGGSFSGSVEEQLALLVRFAEAGALLVDVELETLREATPARLARFAEELAAAKSHLLASAHDFSGTGDPESTLAELRALGAPCGPAIYKVVTTAVQLADNLRMLSFLRATAPETAIVGICMGEAGLVSRVLALASGSLFTFASTTYGPATASGQVSAATLLGEYRAASLSVPSAKSGRVQNTLIYGVAGNPVAHSLSPVMHNAAFRATGIDAVYLPLHTTSVDDLLVLVEGLPLAGLSVTMPWKVELLPRLGAVDPLSRQIGAVNTLVRGTDGSLSGTNTDAAAIVEPLRERLARRDLSLAGARVLVLGAGGAARAAVFGLRAEGCHVSILNRTEKAAHQLAQASGALIADPANLGGFHVIINATPAGMLGHEQQSLLVNAAVLRDVQVLFEMVYRPSETPLTLLGRSLGIEVVYGLTMFLHQGARQWELWSGRKAPEAAMRQAVEAALFKQE